MNVRRINPTSRAPKTYVCPNDRDRAARPMPSSRERHKRPWLAIGTDMDRSIRISHFNVAIHKQERRPPVGVAGQDAPAVIAKGEVRRKVHVVPAQELVARAVG